MDDSSATYWWQRLSFRRRPHADIEQPQQPQQPRDTLPERAKSFCKALLFGGRTRRTARILLGMLPLYIMFIFLPDPYAFGFVSFALVLQYIAIGYQTPKTFGAAAVLEVSTFLGVMIGAVYSTFLFVLAIGVNVYVTYIGILLVILLSEPTFTSASFHPFLGLFPWIIVDSALITDLTKTLESDDVSSVGNLWTGSVGDAIIRNFIISGAISLGFGLIIFLIPPVKLEFGQLYSTASSLLTALSKQFSTLAEAFRGPENTKKVQVSKLNENLSNSFQDDFEPFPDEDPKIMGMSRRKVGFVLDAQTSSARHSRKTSTLRDGEESMKIVHLLEENMSFREDSANRRDFWAEKKRSTDLSMAKEISASDLRKPEKAVVFSGAEEITAEAAVVPSEAFIEQEKQSAYSQPNPDTGRSASNFVRSITFRTEQGDEFVVSRSSSGHTLTREKDLAGAGSDFALYASRASTDTTASDVSAYRTVQSVHYDRVLGDLKSSEIGFEKTRMKVNKTMLTINGAKSEFPLHKPIPIPKRPFSGFAHTCDPALWRSFLAMINRTNRDGFGFSHHVGAILAGYILDQTFLDMIANVLACDATVMQCLSAGMSALTLQDSREIHQEYANTESELKETQAKHTEATRTVKLELQSKHRMAFFRRKAIVSNARAEVGFQKALKDRLATMQRLQSAKTLNVGAVPHHELLDLLLRHYYESSVIAFLSLLGGVRLNAEKGSLVAIYRQVTDKTLHRGWREAFKAVFDFVFMIPFQYMIEYRNWFQLMYSGLVPFSFASSWKSFTNYWKSNRGRHFFRLFVGLALIYAPCVFSESYRTLFNLGDNGRFGGWQIHAFVSSTQNSVEATMKKVFWRVVGNLLGGLVGFVALYISMNKVYHMAYLAVVTILTTWFLNGSEDQYFAFTVQYGYAISAFGVVQSILTANANGIGSTRDLAIFVTARVMAQVIGTVWALVVSMTVFPSFAYDRARDLAFRSLTNVIDQVASKAFEIYLGLADYPLELKEEYENCEKAINAASMGFQQARKDIENAEKFGIVEFLGVWFYDDGEADAILNWAASVLTCVEGLYHMALRSHSTTMGDYRSKACIYRADSELMQAKIPTRKELCNKLMIAFKARFDAVVDIMRCYSRVKNPKERQGWKAKRRKFQRHREERRRKRSAAERGTIEPSESRTFMNEAMETAQIDDEITALKGNLLNKQYEFWLAYLDLERAFVPEFTEEEFESWYQDFYRLDAFLGFLRRLEDLMGEIPV